jgi:hypothetical protein
MIINWISGLNKIFTKMNTPLKITDSYRDPVNGRKLSRHGKSRLRMSPGSNNGVYWSR